MPWPLTVYGAYVSMRTDTTCPILQPRHDMAITLASVFAPFLDSTIWAAPDHHLRCFLTLLLTADQFGECEASVVGLAHRARITRDECKDALEAFQTPDEDDVCLVEATDHGWRVIGYMTYRTRLSGQMLTAKASVRTARWRASVAAKTAKMVKESEAMDAADDIRRTDHTVLPAHIRRKAQRSADTGESQR